MATAQELQLAAIMAADAKKLRLRAERENANVEPSGLVFDADGQPIGTRNAKGSKPLGPNEAERRRKMWTLEKRIAQAERQRGRKLTPEEIETMQHRYVIKQRVRARARGEAIPDLRRKEHKAPKPPKVKPATPRRKYASDEERRKARLIRDAAARRRAGIPERKLKKNTPAKIKKNGEQVLLDKAAHAA